MRPQYVRKHGPKELQRRQIRNLDRAGDGGGSPASSSLTPTETVASRTPAARATTRPPTAEHPRLGSQHQPPLPLVQMRQQHLELRRQIHLGHHEIANTTTSLVKAECCGLILGGP